MSEIHPSSAEFFEQKYRDAADHDPWHFARAAYELERYDAVLRVLEGRRYRWAFEPGCSVGVLTERLAAVCDAVDACDFARTAVQQAQARCAGLQNVVVRCGALGPDAAWDRYDLIVLCEIGYYFSAQEWRDLVEQMAEALQPGATVVLCHWLGRSEDHLQSGDAVHALVQHRKLRRTLTERHEGYLLERLERVS